MVSYKGVLMKTLPQGGYSFLIALGQLIGLQKTKSKEYTLYWECLKNLEFRDFVISLADSVGYDLIILEVSKDRVEIKLVDQMFEEV